MDRFSTFNPQGKVKVRYRGEPMEVFESTIIREIVASREAGGTGWDAPIAAIVDQRLMSLETNVYDGAYITPVYASDPQGELVYRRSLSTLLQAASKTLFPNLRLVVGQSIASGYFYLWQGEPPLMEENLAALEKQMQMMVDGDIPIRQERFGVRRAREKFREAGMHDRDMLLRKWWHETVKLVMLDDYFDIYHGPVAPSTGWLRNFCLRLFKPGIILQFHDSKRGAPQARKLRVPSQLFDVYMETYEWNRIIGVSNIGQLNEIVLTDRINDLIRVSEGLHEKKIASIADMAVGGRCARVILIAGPSSSGKTTFSKRLAVQLKVAGREPVTVSIDDYYVDRDKTPRDENGELDFESIHAVDLQLLNEHLADLLRGREVLTPRYSFEKGERQHASKWKPVQLAPNGVIIIEGIHGLNDKLTASIPAGDKFKIYVSALSQLCLDDANRISTTDVRLLRRIVRDRLYRGYTAGETIAKWPSVKRGETRNIFPFQGAADLMFNSTLPYELSVLKVYAEKFLLEIRKATDEFLEGYRLLKFLDLLVPIFPDRVPHNSIIREFIGGSFFRY
jgi:uridine kinase